MDPETADRLARALEERATADRVTARYGQRFLAVAGVGVLGVALVLSYLHLVDALGTAVYMFALGTLFGLAVAYLQAVVKSARG